MLTVTERHEQLSGEPPSLVGLVTHEHRGGGVYFTCRRITTQEFVKFLRSLSQSLRWSFLMADTKSLAVRQELSAKTTHGKKLTQSL